ncbi:MAG: response regulator transcription factor [Anaerolineae bacterium]|nr:response regulator transcription factor [Anaerolineae bacterium]
MTHVLLICAPALLREGLRLLLATDEDLEPVVAATKADESAAKAADVAVISCARLAPAVFELLHRLQSDFPHLPILIIAAEPRAEEVEAALAAGAGGFLPLDTSPDELIWAIRNVSRGQLTLHPTLLPALAAHLSQSRSDSPRELGELTPREQEVLAHLVHGESDRDIAQALFLSVRTVQTHLAHVYEKLEVHSRTEAAVIAVRAGWFPPPGSLENQ